MALATLITAAAGFSAARRLPGLPAGRPAGRLHGHNFRAAVACSPPKDRGASDVPGLARDLEAALAALRHADLNAVLDDPDDARLARWLGDRLRDEAPSRIEVSSTEDQGATLDGPGTAHAWRRYRFEAAHRLPHVAAGHKCGRMHGHGFAVVVQVPLDPAGADTTYGALDAAWAPLQEQLHYHCLNDIPGLENPTSELLATWLHARLRATLPAVAAVTVFETGSCGARYDGRDHRIWKDFFLDSAACDPAATAGAGEQRLHGHTFRLRLALQAPLDTVLGWAVDFGDVKEWFDPLFRRLDHQPLHELPGLAGRADTLSLAGWILERARRDLSALQAVELYETRGCGVICAATAPATPVLPLAP